MTRELQEENGNRFCKLGLLKIIRHTHDHHGVCRTYLIPEHYFKIACNGYFSTCFGTLCFLNYLN